VRLEIDPVLPGIRLADVRQADAGQQPFEEHEMLHLVVRETVQQVLRSLAGHAVGGRCV